jgi:hypothetical protein
MRGRGPAHRDQLALALLVETDHVHRIRRRYVIVRLQIARLSEHAKEGVHLLPGVVVDGGVNPQQSGEI